MRYLVHRHDALFTHLQEEVVDDLITATTLLLPNDPDGFVTGGHQHRGWFRAANTEAQRVQRIWALFSDGTKLSLDPEDLMDILFHNPRSDPYATTGFRNFEAWIRHTRPNATMAFRLRMLAHGRVQVDQHLPDLTSVFQAIAKGRHVTTPVGSGFVDEMWKRFDPEWFALCACVPDTQAAVPLLFEEAEQALASQHTMLSFLAGLREDLGLQLPQGYPFMAKTSESAVAKANPTA